MQIENSLKILLFIILMFCAWKDWKERIIPNRYLIRGLAVRVLWLLPEISPSGADAIRTFGIKCLITIFILTFGILIRNLTKKGIGMGDIKLMMLMYLYLEGNVWMTAMVYSMFLGMIQAVWVFTKSNKKKIPFAPALLFGTMAAIL